MRRLAFFLTLGALFVSPALAPALASAQGMDGAGPPPQMPDPRQMSGHPRPDPQVPAGVITVKVIRGELAALAPSGTAVHLVAVTTAGKTTMKTVAVNDDGRAEFTGLATDGSAVYYALCLFDGDRLSSDPITLPPRVGVRLMLSGRKLDAAKQPVGPAIDDEKSEDGAPPAAGEVEAVVRSPGTEPKAVLRQLGSPDPSDNKEQKLDPATHTARWGGVAGGPDKVYVIEVPSGLRTFVSTPFMMAPGAGTRRMIFAVDRLLFALQGGGQAEEEALAFELQLVLANMTGMPFDTGEGVVIPLPEGFERATIKEDDPGGHLAIVPGQGVRVTGPMPPGQREVVVQFTLPLKDGRASFDLLAPLGLFQSQMFLLKTGNMVISPGTGMSSAPQTQRADDGREYFQLANLTVAPGQRLRFDVVGLPAPSHWPSVARGLAGLVVALLVVLALAFAIRRPRGAAHSPATKESERRDLVAMRERLYAELVTLERARAARRIEPDAFATQRRGIMTRLVLVHRQLDDLDGPTGATERSAAGES